MLPKYEYRPYSVLIEPFPFAHKYTQMHTHGVFERKQNHTIFNS